MKTVLSTGNFLNHFLPQPANHRWLTGCYAKKGEQAKQLTIYKKSISASFSAGNSKWETGLWYLYNSIFYHLNLRSERDELTTFLFPQPMVHCHYVDTGRGFYGSLMASNSIMSMAL